MIPVKFSKGYIKSLLDSIEAGKPLACSGEMGWTSLDMLAVAGVCWFGVMAHGPLRYESAGIDIAQMPFEQREAVEETFRANISAAIEFMADIAMKVKDNDYDHLLEEKVVAEIRTTDGKMQVIPYEGFKQKE